MRSSYHLIVFLQLIFVIVFIVLTLALFFPLQQQFSERIQYLKQDILLALEDGLGTKVSFSSIHPSIFNFVEIRNLRVYDDKDETILTADRLILYYKLGALFQGRFLAAPRLVKLRGGALFLDRLQSIGGQGQDVPIEDVLSQLSDNLIINLRNYSLRLSDPDSGTDFISIISRGKVSLQHQVLKFDFVNDSYLIASSLQTQSGRFELRGNSQIEGELILPSLLTFSEIRKESILQLYFVARDIRSNLFEVDLFDLYLGYADDIFTLQSIKNAFAVELEYNITHFFQLAGTDEDDFVQDDFVQDASLIVNFLASDWKPSNLLRFREEYQQYNNLLESEINLDATLEFTEDFIPLNSEVLLDAETPLPDIGKVLDTHLQFTYLDQIFNLDSVRLATKEGDGLAVQGSGNLRNQTINLSGSLRNSSIAMFPEFATDFTIDSIRNTVDIRLTDSSFFDVPLTETRLMAYINPDILNIDIEGALTSGEGAVKASVVLPNPLGGSVFNALDFELALTELPLQEVANLITAALGEESLVLPDDLVDSRIAGNISSRIAITNVIETAIDVQNFQIGRADLPLPQLSVKAGYNKGILELPVFDIRYGGQNVQISGDGDLSNLRHLILSFDTRTSSSSEPEAEPYRYSFDLAVFPQRGGGQFYLDGDYQSRLELRRVRNVLKTNLYLGNLPMPLLGERSWLGGHISADIAMDDILKSAVNIHRIELFEAEIFPNVGESELTVSASGTLAEGVQISSIVYNDPVSLLSGSGSIALDNDVLLTETTLSNDLESYSVQTAISLSDQLFNSTIALENFTTRRLGLEGITGLFNTNIVLTQTDRENFLMNFNLQTVNIRMQDEPLDMQLGGSYNGETVLLNQGVIELPTIGVRNIAGRYDRGENILQATTDLFFADLKRNKRLTQQVEVSLTMPGIEKALAEGNEAGLADYWRGLEGMLEFTFIGESGESSEIWRIDALEDNDSLLITGGPEHAPQHLAGLVQPDGQFALELQEGLPVSFKGEGFLADGIIDATLTDVLVAPDTIEIALNILTLRNGKIEGSARVQGNIIDPFFYGTFFLEDLKGDVAFIPEPLLAPSAVIILEEQSVIFSPAYVEAGESRALVQGGLTLDHWIPIELQLSIDSQESNIPIIHDFNSVAVDGWGRGIINLDVNFLSGEIDIGGDVLASATGITISDIARRQEAAAQKVREPITVSLNLTAGRGVEFYWPNRDFPIFRGFAVQDEEILFNFSNRQRKYELSGEVALRGGEIFFFEQDFNIRQGNILFNENENKKFDPIVSLNAEFRSTSRNDPLSIHLEVENNNISQMQPRFTSDPPRSQDEIASLLGGKVTGNEEDNSIGLGNVIATSSQILGQIRILTDFENEIRQTLNLDVLSLRLGLVQNVLENAINATDTGVAGNNPVSLGEYLDNTTLRIGRYFGNDIFFEGNIQLQERNPFERPIEDQLGLTIVPEIRLEFYTPIFTVTWSWTILENLQTLSTTGHRLSFTKDFLLE